MTEFADDLGWPEEFPAPDLDIFRLIANDDMVDYLRSLGFAFVAQTRSPDWYQRAYALAPHAATLLITYAARNDPYTIHEN